MALILAIEPDRRQASQLTAIVRGRLHAEFVLGDSAEVALEALGARVPDLVLTTALLSPKDEAALADRLRALDGAAAHVQTLTIPMLASPASRARRVVKAGGVLSALLGDKGKDDEGPAEGCDPAMFAEQCKEYLERAAHERSTLAEHAALDATPGSTASATTIIQPPVIESPAIESSIVQPPVADAPSVAVAPEQPAPPSRPAKRAPRKPLDDEDAPASLMAAVAAMADEEHAAAVEEPAPADEAQALESREADDQELKGHYEFVDVDLSDMLDDPNRPRARAAAAGVEEEPVEIYELDTALLDHEPANASSETESYTPLARPETRSWPILEGLVTNPQGFDDAAVVKESEATQPVAAQTAQSPADELQEWMDIIEALRRDAEPSQIVRPRAEAVVPAVDVAPAEPVAEMAASEPVAESMVEPAAEAETAFEATPAATDEPIAAAPAPPEPPDADPAADNGANGRKKRRRLWNPVQDEWGFFDPDRAGFAALLEKLEEITDKEDAAKPRRM